MKQDKTKLDTCSIEVTKNSPVKIIQKSNSVAGIVNFVNSKKDKSRKNAICKSNFINSNSNVVINSQIAKNNASFAKNNSMCKSNGNVIPHLKEGGKLRQKSPAQVAERTKIGPRTNLSPNPFPTEATCAHEH